MSTAEDLAHLAAQRAVVEAELERTPAERRPMRINLESRLRILDEEIAALDAVERLGSRARAVLVFGGEPVAEAGAIEVSFGTEALQAFQGLISATAATRGGRKLGARGRIPGEEAYRLFLTGTFPGSFGFELEERRTAPAQDPALLREALDEASRLLLATQTDEDRYADAIAESNPRVVQALQDFLTLLDTHGATLRVTAGGRECHFATPAEVTSAAERTRRTKLHEAEIRLRGVLSGLFVLGGRFEFEVEESGEVLSGWITYGISDPSSLKPYLLARCIAHLLVVTVERIGKEQRRYYLTGIEPLTREGEPPAS